MPVEPKTATRTTLAFVACCSWLVALGALAARSSPAQTDRERSPAARYLAERSVSLDQVGSGELLWRDGGALVPLPIVEIDVELSVTGALLHGRLRQSFHNPTGETIEVLYVFPLPESAAVHRMEMVIGQRRIRSEIQEKQRARRTYEQAKSQGRKAALLDQHRPNLFTTVAANINPDETVTVELEYLEELPVRNGEFRLSFPLTYTPRCGPASDPDSGAPFAAEADVSFATDRPLAPLAAVRVELRPGFALASVASDSHRVTRSEHAGRHTVTPEDPLIVADRDFLLAWRPRLEQLPQTAMFVEQHEGSSYALAMVVPPIPDSEAGLGLATETLFVIDVSGSMQGRSIEQAREALLAALDRLRPEDRFAILKFNDGNELFRESLEHAEGETLEAAREWVGGLEAGGGTMIYPALMRGLQLLGGSASSRPQRLIFLTDGAVGNEAEVLRGITDQLGDARLHAIGIGSAPNRYLMRKMAGFGRGLCEFIPSTDLADNRIDTFFARLERPVMTDLQLEWDGAEAIFPARLRDLHAGEPLVVFAKLRAGAGGDLSLGGYTRNGWVSSFASQATAVPGQGIATRWARAQVGSLEDSLHEGADPDDVRRAVVELGLDFNLVTAYTSLVAVERTPTAIGPARSARLASGLPVGGTDGPLRLLIGLALGVAGLLLLALPALGRS